MSKRPAPVVRCRRSGTARGRAVLLSAAIVASLVVGSPPAEASVLPTGFDEVTLVSGLSEPTTVEWAPDGRMFVAEARGRVK